MIYHPILWGTDYERGNASGAAKPKLSPPAFLKKKVRQR
jgi:hypothetical protein